VSKPKSGNDVSPDGAPASKGPASKSASSRSPSSRSPSSRSKARRFALQALYQIQLTGCSAAAAEQQFLDDHDMKRVDVEYLHALLDGTSVHRDELVSLITPTLDRAFSDLDPVEVAILYIGSYELVHRIDVPYRVVINEAVELARQFGATESHKYVNSILDRLARAHRLHEHGR
jgi:N utilization substance protein B